MNPYHQFRKSLNHGIRGTLVSFILILAVNLFILGRDDVLNFIIIIAITLINSFLIGSTIFVSVYSRHMHHLKHLALLMLVLTLLVFTYLEFPFVQYILDSPSEGTEVKLAIGKLEYTEPIVQEKPDNVEIRIG